MLGCAAPQQRNEVARNALAEFVSAPGQNVRGKLTLTQKGNRLWIKGRLAGLTPGLHGFHVHQHGRCDKPAFASAGAHFNPHGAPHGAPSGERHAGDLGNIEVMAGGVAEITIIADLITLEDGPLSVAGRSLIVHAGIDDLRTQPAGNAGARIGCGVIRPLPE